MFAPWRSQKSLFSRKDPITFNLSSSVGHLCKLFWYKLCTEVKKVVSASKHQYSRYKWVKGTYFCLRFCTASVLLSYDNFVTIASLCVTSIACTERGHARSRFFSMLACRETFVCLFVCFFSLYSLFRYTSKRCCYTSLIIPYLAEIIVETGNSPTRYSLLDWD